MPDLHEPEDSLAPATCPRCGAAGPIPILYGYPSEEMQELEKAGKAVLRGCVVESASPVWHCSRCEHDFGCRRELELERTYQSIAERLGMTYPLARNRRR